MHGNFCEKCGRWKEKSIIGVAHKCPPAWRCWAPEWLGHSSADARRIYHNCSGWAAEEFVKRKEEECVDYSVASAGGKAVVYVMLESVWNVRLDKEPGWEPSMDDPALYVFEVYGEVVAEYHSNELDKVEFFNGE